MRRARIKAVANVPVRRKATQDATASQEPPPPASEVQADIPQEKPIAEINANTEPAPVKPVEVAAVPEALKNEGEQPTTQLLETQNNNEETPKAVPPPAEPSIQSAGLQSPDYAFSGLKSPPYRTDSFRTDFPSIKSPASPSKLLQNRSRFVKPVPRLDGSGRIRRNSVQGSGASASESEDDSRRSNAAVPQRIRNDSCCSIQSNKEAPTNPAIIAPPEVKVVPKRRMVISESARKLAEARREFLQKHGSKAPDRNKLTMYDLIYYNPVTNPMSNSGESESTPKNNAVDESKEDEIAAEADEEDVDEPTAMPVPQVKVGPDGQLIIDEQSLVIEQTGAKKTREALANSEVVIDEGRTGNGFYKRRRKTKDWPKWETLRFYTALNTIGTDFLLMQSLFPKRTRDEIKLKFKKEERTNRLLVEKALKYHQEFDPDLLEKQLASFEEQEKSEELDKKKAKENKEKSKHRKKCHFVRSSIEQEGSGSDEVQEEENVDEPEIIPATDENVEEKKSSSRKANNKDSNGKETKKRQKRKRHGTIDEALDDLIHGARIFVESDSETETYTVKPTRSGRYPKTRKLQAPSRNKLDTTVEYELTKENASDVAIETGKEEEEEEEGEEEEAEEEEEEEVSVTEMMTPSEAQIVPHAIPDMSNVEPGSLVILSSESPNEPGKTMLQVFMVNPNIDPADPNAQQHMTPIDLSPELLATVTTKIMQSDSNAKNGDGKPPVETV